MHLLPSAKLREAFSYQYLKKLEWNSRRMNLDKRRRLSSKSSEEETLLNKEEETQPSSPESPRGRISALREKIFIVLYCCSCCCFFQACLDGEEDDYC